MGLVSLRIDEFAHTDRGRTGIFCEKAPVRSSVTSSYASSSSCRSYVDGIVADTDEGRAGSVSMTA
jgi:hypothetical protein